MQPPVISKRRPITLRQPLGLRRRLNCRRVIARVALNLRQDIERVSMNEPERAPLGCLPDIFQ
ncbi:MAG TPA: hypothetical protein VEL31_10175, partial [Ktedonobacteraceae bacterium]|nr:hypothetical protein [Ktedonobacteraceae bacterium]